MKKALILTVGYGHGHRSAAEGIAQELLSRGIKVRVEDPCEADSSGLYTLTKAYYQLCVRRAPWLWAMAYSQTDTADWSSKVTCPGIRTATERIAELLVSWRPDVVVCTYPLFAYMVDYLRARGTTSVLCAVVVTDSLEISKPWIKSKAELLFVPDEYSRNALIQRYGLADDIIFSSGFPVRQQFLKSVIQTVPSSQEFRIVYGAYLGVRATIQQVLRLSALFPCAEITLLAGDKYRALKRRLPGFHHSGKLTLLHSTEKMDELLRWAHLYIGKAGAATIFECYAAAVPIIVNYALPGQEQGNLELVLRDETGVWAGETGELCAAVTGLMCNGASGWKQMRQKMLLRRDRAFGARAIVDVIESHLNKR
ncbi:MAG: hypothetical protein IJ498_06220 [Akkermansia sp.]|nr:hypothetical protein [Akkermansia sp.]